MIGGTIAEARNVVSGNSASASRSRDSTPWCRATSSAPTRPVRRACPTAASACTCSRRAAPRSAAPRPARSISSPAPAPRRRHLARAVHQHPDLGNFGIAADGHAAGELDRRRLHERSRRRTTSSAVPPPAPAISSPSTGPTAYASTAGSRRYAATPSAATRSTRMASSVSICSRTATTICRHRPSTGKTPSAARPARSAR